LKKSPHVGRGHPVDDPVPKNKRKGFGFFAEQLHILRSQMMAVAAAAAVIEDDAVRRMKVPMSRIDVSVCTCLDISEKLDTEDIL
jgi:hypothetical protein